MGKAVVRELQKLPISARDNQNFFDSFYFSWWIVRHFRMVACLVFSRLGKARGDGRVEYRLVDTGLNNLNGSGTQDALPFELCEEVPCSNHKRLSLLLKGRT